MFQSTVVHCLCCCYLFWKLLLFSLFSTMKCLCGAFLYRVTVYSDSTQSYNDYHGYYQEKSTTRRLESDTRGWKDTNQPEYIAIHISWSLSQSVPVIVIVMLLFMFTNTLLMLLLKLRGHHPLPPLLLRLFLILNFCVISTIFSVYQLVFSFFLLCFI